MFQDGAHGPRGPRRALRSCARALRCAARCLALLAPFGWLAPAQAQAQVQSGADEVCEAAASMAAEAEGVPLEMMRALTRVETGVGRGEARRGWPWSANADGRTYRFDSLEEALAFARGPVAHAASNVDLGCFQISRRWHGEAFADDHEMLDPARNALYAARLLSDHYARLGDWTLAAGAYHSRTEAHAGPYRQMVSAELAALGPVAEVGPIAPDLGPRLAAGAGSSLVASLPMPSQPIPVRQPARGAGGGVFTRVSGYGSAPIPEAGPEAEARVELASFEPDAPIGLDPPLDPAQPSAEPRRAGRAAPLLAAARPLIASPADGAGAAGGAPGSLVPSSGGGGSLLAGGGVPLLGPRGWGG